MTATIPTPIAFDTPLDYKDEIRAQAGRVRWLTIPSRRYLVIDGTEAPGSPDFQDAIGALYPVAYTLHFTLKGRGVDASVGALQGLYWLGGQAPTSGEVPSTTAEGRAGWRWRLMLPIPDAATTTDIEAAIRAVRMHKQPPRIDEVWVHTWEEGPAAQILHIGRYADEPTTIARLQAEVADLGLRTRGVHHEIYISDPNRAAPERMRTLLRQDVEA